MGLDMFVSKVKGTWTQESFVEFRSLRGQLRYLCHESGLEELDLSALSLDSQELGYFRKHSDLHGYFEELYFELTPEDYRAEVFNCEYLVLDREMINDILDKAKQQLKGEKSFKEARGFFWGESDYESWEETIDVFTRILNQVDFEKETVLYSSWW